MLEEDRLRGAQRVVRVFSVGCPYGSCGDTRRRLLLQAPLTLTGSPLRPSFDACSLQPEARLNLFKGCAAPSGIPKRHSYRQRDKHKLLCYGDHFHAPDFQR